jgi:hypothetical protein
MNRFTLQVEELEPRCLLSGQGAVVERFDPRAIQINITLQICVDEQSIPVTADVQAVESGRTVTDPHGGVHQQSLIKIPKATLDILGQEFSVQGHSRHVSNQSPSGASNFTNTGILKVDPLNPHAGCPDQTTVETTLQHQTINANGEITASIGLEPPIEP